MRLPDAVTPLRVSFGLFLIAAVVVAISLWNPWSGYLRQRVAKAEAGQETSQDALQGQIEANAGQAEVEAAAQEVRVIIHEVREATHAVEIEARAAPDADAPIDPSRADRLRAHDRELCRLRPTICSDGPDGPAAGPDDPG